MNLHLHHIEREHINCSDTDYKAEVVAGLLVEKGYSPDKVLIVRKGASKRGVSKDIASLYHGSYKNMNTSLVLHANRKGIYDHLPEGLFHRSSESSGERSKESVLTDMNKHRVDEFFIRDFFRLFETESDITRILIQSREFQFDKKNNHDQYILIYEKFWPILKQMDRAKAVLFMKMLPLVSKIRLSREKISRTLGLILDVPVNIEPDHNIRNENTPVSLSKLGDAKLGRNLITSGYLAHATKRLQVKVGPIPSERIESFMEGNHSYNVLNLMLDNLLPANAERIIKLNSSPEGNSFKLGTKKSVVKMFLGVNTWLQ